MLVLLRWIFFSELGTIFEIMICVNIHPNDFIHLNYNFKSLGLRDFCEPDSETLISDTR